MIGTMSFGDNMRRPPELLRTAFKDSLLELFGINLHQRDVTRSNHRIECLLRFLRLKPSRWE